MKRGIYGIHDKASNSLVGMRMYSLMTFLTPVEATRYFADAINDTTSILNKHPEDYALVRLGTLEDGRNGETITEALDQYEYIITGNQIIGLQAEPEE